jgi:excinuclease ABC subunit A
MGTSMKHQKNHNSSTLLEFIEIMGAREHNLKNIDVSIPKNKLVGITGLSGSGKSSLAFDTIYNEGQRRYMESFSAYARQFIGDMERPDVDKITGLSPVMSIEQKTTNKNPRSTVGTITEVYDFLRLLYARVAEAYSYETGKKMVKFSEKEIIDHIYASFPNQKISILAPLVRGRKGHYRELFEEIRKKGFLKVRIDGETKDVTAKLQVDRYKVHDIEVVVDRMAVTTDMRLRIVQSVETALKLGKDLMFILLNDTNKIVQYSSKLMCVDTGISYEEPSPNAFSFNSPYGACTTCKGLGSIYSVSLTQIIPDKSISIKEGGIVPLGAERNAQLYQQMAAFAKKNKININVPINQLKEEQINLLLFATENPGDIDNALIANSDASETNYLYDSTFEGVIPMLKRWFTASGSTETTRECVEQFMELKTCPTCNGARLKKESLWFKINNKNIAELGEFSLEDLANWFKHLPAHLTAKQQIIAKDVLKEINDRLGFLNDVGLTYLHLNRSSRTLSGGESQRIRLATQIGSQLQGITHILDEPSIGLHQRDNHRLIQALQNLRDIGNTVIVVEHDKDIMLEADYLIDIGPKAGKMGGQVVAAGTPSEVMKMHTPTAGYLNGSIQIPVPSQRRKGNGNFIEIKGASGNNLKNVHVKFPLGTLILVTGVSGSGKSTLINETLYPLLAAHAYDSRTKPMPFKSITGLENIDKVIEIDQSPIGRTPRSNPATYCGFFTDIRTLFASVPEAKIRGYNA